MEMPRTRKAVLLLLAATAPTANSAHAATLESGLRYGFSECVDFKRTLYYYRDEEETCATGDSKKIIAKPPVHGLRCDLTCERGYFLGANFSGETPVSGCEKCDKGQYSLGGGKLYSKRTNAWSDPLPIDIHTDCVTRNMYTGQWQSNCAPWNASIDGAMISSGENSEIMERYEAARLFSTLRISATFVRDGSITYQFRVDAEAPYDGLVFEVDDTAVTPLISKTDGWNEASFEVAAGSHTFSWDYTKDYQGDEGEDKAFLKVIEIVGTSYSDTFCHPCGGDMTMSGGSICKFCKANEYAAAKSDSELDFTCYKCPEGMVSPKGSIGLDSCVEKRACTADDLVETFTECVDGKRNATFAWSEPRTCDLKLHNSIALPEAQINLSCNTCDLGYTLSEQDTCERCPPGQKLGETNECEQCPAGQVVVNALEFGTGTKDGWSKWPSIMDSVAAKRSGWKLTRHALSFTAHAKGEGEWSRPSRFPVPFNATFVHSGFINLTYELSHVPTFENDGVRAWLELEIRDTDAKSASKDETNTDAGSDDDDDDDNDDDEQLWGDLGGSIAHLAHGSENGTHSEIIHFNVTSRTTKQFTLVLRTTSPAAARMVRAKILHLGFVGTENGGSVTCGSCPAGYEAMSTDDGASADGCRVCPAGTFGKTDNNGVTTCEKCPVNTISAAGATECERCGNNTFSEAGAVSCAAPTTLTVDASPTNSSFVTANGATSVSYDLTLLESLVWGNDSFLFGDDMIAVRAKDQLSVAPVVPNGGIKIDTSHKVFVGLFRPVDKSWKSQLMGQIVEEHVDAVRDFPYVIELTMLNPRDAGNFFIQNTGRYGQVECAAPAQWKASSGGSRMEIVPLSNGGGVQVHYTGGSICRNGQAASTEINFVCDPNAGTTVAPSATSRDEETCTTKITWSTAYACPICEAAYFNELRSACSSGQQSITYNNVQPCYGGKRPSSVPVATCNEVVLDTKAMYTVYAVISVVGIIVLLLMAAIFVTHRKYLTAYNEYMYLKGKMPTSVSTKEDGSKETTFEFANNSNTAHASPVPGRDDETKEEEDEGIEMNVRSV